jgi:hypothetical protein
MYDPNRRVVFPTQFEAEIDLRSTQVLSYLVKTWGEIPMAFIQHLQLHEYLYGFIGTTDFTMYPFVRPGTLVQIDDRDKKVRATGWSTDFDRPIYFFQLRDRYAFGWCQIEKNTLSIIPYEASRRPVRTFAYPDQIEVIGRVTRAVMSFMPTDQATGRPSSS